MIKSSITLMKIYVLCSVTVSIKKVEKNKKRKNNETHNITIQKSESKIFGVGVIVLL